MAGYRAAFVGPSWIAQVERVVFNTLAIITPSRCRLLDRLQEKPIHPGVQHKNAVPGDLF